jgi:hypothetical protein
VQETALVIGPVGQEIATDSLGRVRVQFYWDRDGGQSSCWVRVAQAWAGSGFGSQFIPRVGMEVLVSFLGGNSDRPVITGCLHNAANVTPFRLPDAKQVSGIRTRSSPDSLGYNELSFDDSVGAEQVLLRSERNLDLQAGHDRTESVGARRSSIVQGDDQLQVGLDREGPRALREPPRPHVWRRGEELLRLPDPLGAPEHARVHERAAVRVRLPPEGSAGEGDVGVRRARDDARERRRPRRSTGASSTPRGGRSPRTSRGGWRREAASCSRPPITPSS